MNTISHVKKASRLHKLKKTVLVVGIKLLLSCLAFYVISKKVTFNPINYLNSSSIEYFLAAFAVAILIVLLQAGRWQLILSLFATRIAFHKSLIAVWFGHLINHLVPSAAAGDLLRSYTLKQVHINQSKWKWLGAFLLEKYCAAVSTLFIASLALLTPIHHELPAMLSLLVVLLTLSSLLTPVISIKVFNVIQLKKFQRFINRIQQLSQLFLQTFTSKIGRLAFNISTLINLGMCVVFYLIAFGLGVDIHFSQCLFVVPVFTLLASLPISFAGWGVRELSCVGLLSFFGTSSETALIVSVMYGLLFFISSLPGLLVAYPFILSLKQREMIEVGG